MLSTNCHPPTNYHEDCFNVTAQHVRRKPEDKVTYTKELMLEYQGTEFLLGQGGELRINGIVVSPIAAVLPSGVNILFNGKDLVLWTDNGLEIRWDGINRAEITVSPDFHGQLSGLCGNYDITRSNDWIMPNGTQATNPEMFGDSWIVDETGCKTEEANPCQDFADVPFAEDLCYIIKDPEGPFQECNKYVDPELYYDACVYDACATLPDEDVICADIAVYAEACRQAGHPPDSWRSDDFCPLPCPDPAYYSPCAPECPETCAGYSEGPLCDSCREGCVCPAGFVWDDYECVPKEHCGCLHEDHYYSIGDSWITDYCMERCSCLANMTVQCEPNMCHPDAYCGIANGTRTCICNPGYDCLTKFWLSFRILFVSRLRLGLG
ncbi:zonadhesin-like [Amphiura filiformis]|uniref:zonadhesin-like n=1 Tax=Amphiura filiformis TaxID=82378 RepID=UPI003B213F02